MEWRPDGLGANEIPDAVQWHEGMLLTPQHFQIADARLEALAQYGSLLAAPYAWGLRRLKLDSRLLPSGTFRILELEAVLPDGTVASRSPGESEELSADFSAMADRARQGPLPVYLALPARSETGVKGTLARYRGVPGEGVADENTGESGFPMPRKRLAFELLAGDAPPAKYVSFPLAHLKFENESFVLGDYIPPRVAVERGSDLSEIAGHVVKRLRAKAIYVAEQMRAPGAAMAAGLQTENRVRLQSIASALPLLEVLLQSGLAQPFSLYQALCLAAGSLAAIGASLLPPVFGGYDHRDARRCFEEVAGFCLRALDEGVPENYRVHVFDFRDGVFSLPLDGEWLARKLVLGMRAATGVADKDLQSWGENCLIGSASVVPSLRDRRILGAARRFVESDEDLIPSRGVLLFALRPDPEFVRAGEPLEILNIGEKAAAAQPLQIALYVRSRS
ncbi:MAG: type VI secretion system baseplate subunit TssK [Bryobacteraceae bacterium]|nr:type VI secretion system baseplate subunit TssK [Bryobacteraceae bacterium]